ncbi:hypothetical protein OA57_08385 [Chelonobacter oris]|uniref:CRISPR-associated protein Cse3 n=1 Tax=Chelonobacter oris TaxID=505317 RepID=A0A0A3B918_9PAST|nr:type I-E CRISPR-associated protein Cas6/Cse3/CasE [Chelonobacter oris]KGQ70069.1 hypothetical protein OA57_08385 [Chelonobacter oris]
MNKALYASVLKLGRREITRFNIRDAYALHKVIYSLFDKGNAGLERRFLYCEKGTAFDLQSKEYVKQVILLSSEYPQNSVRDYCFDLKTCEIPDGFLQHQQYRFEIKMNVAKRDNQSQKMTPLKDKEAIFLWFLQKNAQWGFQADPQHLQINAHNVMRFDKGERAVTLNVVTFQGVLCVTDRIKFQHGFQQGIGRGRSFGLGLLQLIPINDTFFSI